MGNKLSMLILLLTGGVTSFAYTPFNYTALLFAGYALLFYCFYKSTTLKQAILYGLCFGFSHYLIGTYWLFSVVEGYSPSSKLALVLIVGSVIFLLAFYFALLGGMLHLIRRKYHNNAMLLMIILPILASFMEWLKSWFATGFTWLTPADALFDYGFSPFLPLFGPLGIGFIFYLLVAAFVAVIVYRTRIIFVWFGLVVLVVVLSSIFLRGKIYTDPMKSHIKTQIIQANFTKADKSKRYKTIQRIHRFQTFALLDPKPELSIWPESSMSLSCQVVKRKTRDGFSKLKKEGVEVLYGGYDETSLGSYNTITKNSTGKRVYTKQHLMPFGEYTPHWLTSLQTLLPDFFMDDLTTNQETSLITYRGLRIAPSICYEILFPDELRESMNSANLLLHVSDLGWFESLWAQEYLLALARMRAIESQKPLVYVVNQGISAFISHQGSIIKQGSQVGTTALYHTVVPRYGTTPYTQYGNTPLWAVIVILLLFVLSQHIFTKFKGVT